MTQKFFNPAHDIVTIYTAAGETHDCTRLNARELVSGQGFHWTAPATATAIPAEVVADAPVAGEPVLPDADADADADTKPAAIDHKTAPLSAVAEALTGNTDVAKYLTGFPVDDLRVMAEERYGEKLSARAYKDADKTIAKIIELEEAKTASELDA